MSPVKQASAPETQLISTTLASVSNTISKIEIKHTPKNALDPRVGDYISAVARDVALLADEAAAFNQRQQTLFSVLQNGAPKLLHLFNQYAPVFDDFTFEAYGRWIELHRYIDGMKIYKGLLPLDAEFVESYVRTLSSDQLAAWYENLGSLTNRQQQLIEQIGQNIESIRTAFEIWQHDKESLMYSIMPYFEAEMQPLLANEPRGAHKRNYAYIQRVGQSLSSIGSQIEAYRESRNRIRPLTRDEAVAESQTLGQINTSALLVLVKCETMKLNATHFLLTEEQVLHLGQLMQSIRVFTKLLDDLRGVFRMRLCLDTLED